ncbi:glycosyl transferase family 2 [Rhizocola hellebori]|uniref:Glycosyl transferase family 2 n=1 Tax=Rhizocola hellebori TaxID=1392758 RepID=A0A8J3QFR9_9ACTN|nr:glycosyltransferase family 2 protein [Rhizocola hellebori]GIH10154.1 glycosyl transferase family 2 [Rhizocola hellebori]
MALSSSGQGETVAVVSVTFNSERLLADLVASLETGMQGVSWHLTVADNASTDASTSEIRRLLPEATVVEMGRNAGYAAGINAAVAAAPPHTAILVLNPDIRLTAGCAKELLSVLGRETSGIVVPQLERGDGSYIPVLRREPTVLRALGDAMLGARRAGKYPMFGEIVTGDRYYQSETMADWAAGSAMLISAECWQRCAPWDESFFLYSEETDFALRARDAGLPTRLAPAARAVHLEGDSKQSPGLWALLMVNRARLYRRRHGFASSAAYWAALVLREASRALLGSKPSRAAVRSLTSPARLRQAPSAQTVRANG